MARRGYRARKRGPEDGDGHWAYPFVIRHPSGKLIRRRDGKRFKIWIKHRKS